MNPLQVFPPGFLFYSLFQNLKKNQEFLARSYQPRKISVDEESNKTKEESSSGKERKIASQELESLERDNKMQNRFQNRQKSHDYDSQDSGFAAAVAATAFAIYSLEEQEADNQRRMKEEFKMSKIGTGERRVDITAGSGKVTRRISSTKIKDAGETSSRRQMEQDQKMKESTLPGRRTSRSLSMRNSAGQRQKGNSTGRDVVETKAESWEKTRLQKLNKRYDKMKSDILAWENAKKMQTKLSMERKEKELEIRRMANLRHYQNKLARIDLIAEGARRQLEEKRINEESKLKGKEKYMKSKGRSPINCFCC